MIVYLSLRQMLLNQINVLLKKQQDKSNDEPERLQRRLNNLQTALEQIKSYEHNSTYKYVIKHFNIELSESEQKEIRDLSRLYDDGQNDGRRGSKTGFTTQRSETLFTGAAVELNDNNYYGSDNEMDDEKTPRYGLKAPQWIHYRGFAHWLRKQSFIKFNKRNDQEKYRKIWNNLLGLHFINQWEKGKIKPRNIIGPYGSSKPYIGIYQAGTKDIVKASLLRLSMTQNRIFRFKMEREDSAKGAQQRSRARRSIDMDNDEDAEPEMSSTPLTANQFMHGLNLFNQVTNKDTLRIVATMLWDTSLANSVLEELLHNPRFSMYGIHAKNIADTIAKEMNLTQEKALSYTPDYVDEDQRQLDEQQAPSSSPQDPPVKVKDITHGGYDQVGTTEFPQFQLPSPQRPVSMQKQKEISQNDFGAVHAGNAYPTDHHQQYQQQQQQQQQQLEQRQQQQRRQNEKGGSLYSPQFTQNSNNSYTSNATSASTFSFTQPNKTASAASSASTHPASAQYKAPAKPPTKPQQNTHMNNTHNTLTADYGHNDHWKRPPQTQPLPQQQPSPSPHGYKSTPEPIPEEELPPDEVENPRHKPHSGSVVFHDNLRDSEIMEAGLAQQPSYDHYSDGDDEEESGYDDAHEHH
eukprot:CAMPEP_0197073870 /NCGR_PEP_ID=MMETSP1384-20130603/210819_1 /TAXON_ID=29189 /ORGANISM="Ammonia sp." /LENGTH=633 /DNA_ID=CAMNT_0042512711 /DNA_START=113 /DNA_END=2014 /DNA_ORIENTATION=+